MGNLVEHVRFMSGKYENPEAQTNVIYYALKHNMESPVGGCAVYPLSPESADNQFQIVKEKYGKTDGRQIFHMCLTYADDLPATREQALKDAKNASDLIGTQYQNIYGLHENTDNVHVHFAINSVSYISGKKITSEQIEELLSDA